MKVLPFKIPKPEKTSLVYQEDYEEAFYDKFHQHDEIQISYIVEGSGSVILGDSINEYVSKDIIVIGENIPHVFKSDSDTNSLSLMYTLFFTKKSFGEEFFNLTELSEIKELFEESEYGLKIKPQKEKLYKIFHKLKKKNKIQRIASLLNILEILIHSERQPLSSFIYDNKYTKNEEKRMNEVFQFTLKHFPESISLDEVAEKAYMSKNAFCRYFKKRTNKTYFQFLIEVRIDHACKLLFKDKELPISKLPLMCGFNNIANFNRKFKELKGMTPSQYRVKLHLLSA